MPESLGRVVSWRVPKTISITNLRLALEAAGFSPDLAIDMSKSHAIKRALRDMSDGRVIKQLIHVDKDSVSFQVTQEIIGEDNVIYTPEAKVTLDTKSGEVTSDSDSIKETAKKLLDEHMGKRMTSDLTRLVQRIYDSYKADLIPIREAGGAYFVPEMHSGLVDQSQKLLKAIGGDLRQLDVRLGHKETDESLAQQMNEYLLGLVNEFHNSIEHVSKVSRRDVKTHREEKIGELRSKLECYKGVLGGFVSGIEAAIETADKELIAKLEQTLPEPASV